MTTTANNNDVKNSPAAAAIQEQQGNNGNVTEVGMIYSRDLISNALRKAARINNNSTTTTTNNSNIKADMDNNKAPNKDIGEYTKNPMKRSSCNEYSNYEDDEDEDEYNDEQEEGSGDDDSRKQKSKKAKTSKGGSSNAFENKSIEAKREYNRNNAARFRQRRKEMLERLQNDLRETQDQLKTERTENAKLKVQIEILLEQNRELSSRVSQLQTIVGAQTMVGASANLGATNMPSSMDSLLGSGAVSGGGLGLLQGLSTFNPVGGRALAGSSPTNPSAPGGTAIGGSVARFLSPEFQLQSLLKQQQQQQQQQQEQQQQQQQSFDNAAALRFRQALGPSDFGVGGSSNSISSKVVEQHLAWAELQQHLSRNVTVANAARAPTPPDRTGSGAGGGSTGVGVGVGVGVMMNAPQQRGTPPSYSSGAAAAAAAAGALPSGTAAAAFGQGGLFRF